MVIHIALYKWKDGVSEADIASALSEVEALAPKIPGIVEISTARNTSKYSEGYSHVILVRGKDQSAIDDYRRHPDHEAVANRIDAMEQHGIGVDFVTAHNAD